MKRIDRVSAILIQLQSKRVVKASEIAERFNISLRTVYRDIRTLEAAGIPLISEAGVGYSLMEGYKLPPVMFTKDEALSMLTAEKLVQKMTDDSTSEFFTSSMYKIKSVLRNSEKDFLNEIDKHIEIFDHTTPGETNKQENIIPQILKCINEKKVLNIKYFAEHNETMTERDTEPIGIFYKENKWHLIAFCRLRNDYRDFRLDRIHQLKQTEKDYTADIISLQEYFEKMKEQEHLEEVVVSFDNSIIKYIQRQKYYYGFVREVKKDDRTEVTFLVAFYEPIARWLLMFTDYIDIISTDELRETLKKHIIALQKHFL